MKSKILFCFGLWILVVAQAAAGTVTLHAERYFCEVYFSIGPAVNPDDESQIFVTEYDVDAGFEITSAPHSQICYKRTRDFVNCDTGLQDNWYCHSNPISGIEEVGID